VSWRGEPVAYRPIVPGVAGGGGAVPSALAPGTFAPIVAGVAGGGGRVPSSAEPVQGLGGCGGPGPGALIGLSR
jgi:hypothetical protein